MAFPGQENVCIKCKLFSIFTIFISWLSQLIFIL